MKLPDLRQFAGVLKGNNSSQGLFGSSDDELLLGEGGDDVLSGGNGNDTLIGGNGNDKYLFALGDGQDVIINQHSDSKDKDVLSFGPGISSSQVTVSRLNNSLVLQINGTSDQVKVEDYFLSNGDSIHSLDSIVFDDGTSWKIDDVTRLVTTQTETNSLPISVQSLDSSLNLLVQSYTAFGVDEDSDIGAFNRNHVNILPIVTTY